LFVTPERNPLFDVNDFDETLPAPRESDIKRLAVSSAVAARDHRLSDADAREAAEKCGECSASYGPMRVVRRTMKTMRMTSHYSRLLVLVLFACVTVTMDFPARADDRGEETLLESNAYIQLSDKTRMFLLGDVAISKPYNNAEAGANLDIALKPLFRPLLREADWARQRYLWMRLGYVVLASPQSGASGPTEQRGVAELTGRLELPVQVWLVNRARVDLREIGGEFSRRYRLRVGVERIFTVNGAELIPYSQAETYYDTRYGTWNRQLYQVGIDIEISNTWHIEPYVARQNDSMSLPDNLDRFGLVLKYYQ
jgi:hypothetical protein